MSEPQAGSQEEHPQRPSPPATSEPPEVEIISPPNETSPQKVADTGGATGQLPPSKPPPASASIVAMMPPPDRVAGRWRQMTFGVANEATFRKEIAERDAKLEELGTQLDQARSENDVLNERLQELTANDKELHERIERYQSVMGDVMKAQAQTQRREARRAQHNQNFEVGQVLMVHHINGPQEMWVHGNRYREILDQLSTLHRRVTEVEACAKEARDSHRASSRRLTRTLSAQQANAPPSLIGSIWEAEEQQVLHGVELGHLNTRINALNAEKESLEGQRFSLLKEIRRLDDEDTSEFASQTMIGRDGRYILLHLLGKGGFSEVWKAFDLEEARYVACKIHHVNKSWNHQTKQNYLRHALRELEIQRQLDHPRVTKLFDVFQYEAPGQIPASSSNTFVSVTEFCGGVDLDTHLKRERTIGEAEARVLLMQIVSGLRHLWESHIIHFDLKPANVLFASPLSSCLEIKLTDFGLAKRIAGEGNAADPTIELTSQGAGTMWYAPPEVFEENAKISHKVDIWAAGVIFYQMLYGRMPFADGESQKRIWSDKLITKFAAKGLEFPAKPPKGEISNEAKDLIRRCLLESPSQRPDIMQLSTDPYLCRYARKRPRTALTSAMSGPITGASPTFTVPPAGANDTVVREESPPPGRPAR